MNFELFLTLCNYLGTIAFAVSGTAKGFKHKLDLFGFTLLAMITACGGGMIRDMMLSEIPAALVDPTPIYLSILVSLLMYAFVIRQKIDQPRTQKLYRLLTVTNLTFDAIGLVIFALIGASKGVELAMNPMASGLLATLTGVGGGIIRDLLVNEVPIVLKADVYAVLAFGAGLCYHLLVVNLNLPAIPVYLVLFIFCLVIRLLIIRYKINLPSFNPKPH
ncbi:trimeric intracellular cation channel family protein [Streptococcus merionis]|uniref:Membrane protein n=1 Tax=Streptococcus merionis TaxID=400065 RepID=A0A239SVC4_9STRE|nr:trimeric intracellular cation channel family protein [Streptococcus merionis]SNU89182.1 membrane protein [Streptococcus merionis]